jgi:hypothetical protein
MKQRRVWFLLALLVVVLLATQLLEIEWISVEFPAGPSIEAQRDPFLAANQYLRSQGYRVARHESLRDFDDPQWAQQTPADDVVVLVDTFGLLSRQRIERLLAWVNEGGTLIVSARTPYQGAAFTGATSELNDPLLERFGLQLAATVSETLNEQDWRQLSEFSQLVGFTPDKVCAVLGSQAVMVFEEGDEERAESLSMHFLRPEYFVPDSIDTSARAIVGGGEPRLVQFEHGNGLLTFMVSLELWKNHAIGCQDHAWILQNFAPLHDGDGVLHFYYNLDRDSLLEVAWQRFPAAIMLLGVLLLYWLWYRAARCGPLQSPPVSAGPPGLSHSRASGDFLWDHSGGETLAAALREELTQLFLREGFVADAAGRFLLQDIAMRLRLPADLLETAMQDRRPMTPMAFTAIVNAYQIIRARL